jgi:hypothetical protein
MSKKIIMKKLICFALFILFAKPTFAVVDPKIVVSPARKQIQEIKQIREASKAAKKEINRDRINEHFEVIKDSLQTRYEFLLKIKNKTEAKLGENLDAKEKFSEFDKHQTNYLNNLNNLENKIGDILTSETPGKIIPELRSAVQAVRNDLNSMRKVLVETIKFLIKKI